MNAFLAKYMELTRLRRFHHRIEQEHSEMAYSRRKLMRRAQTELGAITTRSRIYELMSKGYSEAEITDRLSLPDHYIRNLKKETV